jgi:hypothetical protein
MGSLQIGLDGWTHEDAGYFADLGVQWTKLMAGEIDTTGITPQFEALVAGAADAGLKIVCDLRPSGDTHQQLLQLATRPSEEDLAATVKGLADAAAMYAKAFAGVVDDWEFWGEFDCPYVGGFYLAENACYPTYIRAVHEAMHEAAPGCRLWNGGYGVNFQPEFLHALAEHAPSSFDKANWHHYNVAEYWSRGPDGEPQFAEPLHKAARYTADLYRRMFTDTRAVLSRFGCQQAYVSSEWGMPVVSDAVVKGARAVGLHNYAFQDGIYGLGESDAVAYLDAWLEAFEQAGFEVLVYHRLRDNDPQGSDNDGTFWGVYCGLLFADGTPKLQYGALKQWAMRGRRGG